MFGRKAGSARDYGYSNALRTSQIILNETLDEWLADPEKLIPGQRMSYSVPDPAARADPDRVPETGIAQVSTVNTDARRTAQGAPRG